MSAPVIGQDLPRGWTEFLEAWFEVMTRFISASSVSRSADIPYWYNERSNAGHLAAAAWSLGGIAIQEFTVERGEEGRDELTRKARTGWCDLWIYVPTLGLEYDIEAKFQWLYSLKGGQTACEKLVGQAVDQIRDYAPEKKRPCDSMAVCFLPVCNKSKSEAEATLDELEAWFATDYARSDNLLAIYKAPLGVAVDHVYSQDGVRYFYPGVALYGQLVRFTKLPVSLS